jgi:hypothetical protein
MEVFRPLYEALLVDTRVERRNGLLLSLEIRCLFSESSTLDQWTRCDRFYFIECVSLSKLDTAY